METLALIELLDRDGLPRHSVRVTEWPVRIGRAVECEVVLDDPHVAPHHASLIRGDRGVHVVPVPTVNGVRFGRARVAAGSAPPLPASGVFTVGTTALRVRLAGEPLAPELPLALPHWQGRHAVTLSALALSAALWAAFQQWLDSAPGASSTEMVGLFLGVPAALGVWCGLWALGSKLFQRQFAFWPHLEAALLWPLAAVVVQALSGQLAFAFSAPWIAKAGRLAAVGAIAVLLWRHLSIVLPQRRRAFALVIGAIVVVGGGLDAAERLRHQQPLVGGLYLDTLSLPRLRIARAVSADAFVQSAQPLEQTLGRWAKAPGDGDLPAADDE